MNKDRCQGCDSRDAELIEVTEEKKALLLQLSEETERCAKIAETFSQAEALAAYQQGDLTLLQAVAAKIRQQTEKRIESRQPCKCAWINGYDYNDPDCRNPLHR